MLFQQIPQAKAYEKYPLWKVQKMFPFVDWVDYLNALLPAPLSVDTNEEVILWIPQYLDAFGKLLNESSKRTTANFLMWKMVEYSINFLDEEVNKRRLAFEAWMYGKRHQEPKWITCTDVTNERCVILEQTSLLFVFLCTLHYLFF